MISLQTGRAGALAALILAAAPAPAQADAALDLIFAEGQLEAIETGAVHGFRYSRANAAAPDEPAVEDGRVTLALQEEAGERSAVLRIDDGQRERFVSAFPAGAGNPVLLLFLEQATRAVADATGGSPFYIRNRIKDAFRAGATLEAAEAEIDGRRVAAQRATYAPFAREAETDRLGIFADLELSFMLSSDVPGGFVSLTATSSGGAEGGYLESLRYDGREDGQ